jgi:phosphoribosylanthranilate isomerase
MSDVQIKICGLTTPETIDAAVAAGSSHIGLVHYEPSPRHVSLDQAARLRARVPERVKVVLLLVNAEVQPTIDAIAAVKPDVIQFHGSESAEWLALLKEKTPLEIWKAVGVRDESSLQKALKFKGAVHRVLYDAAAGKLPGGNGLALDWSLLTRHRHEIPWGLAGGLTPENVADAIRQTGAELVDTSSGVESAPGVKDVDRITAFCQSARNI